MPSPAGTTVSNVSTIGYGLDLAFSTNLVSPSYTSLGQLTDVTDPDIEVGDVDKTGLLSPSATREYRPGLIKPGKCTFKLIFNATQKAQIFSLMMGRTTCLWKITYPDGASVSSTETFQGYINGYSGENPIENNIMADVSIKASGPITFTGGS
jgi:hypothetical protein